ncbi:MAG: N-acetyltransferase [Chloroflexia bacterium]|nr:N-acetyltransferase [Chloroflexia bacterium]
MGASLALEQPDSRAIVTLEARDGRRVKVRHMRREDAILLKRMFYRLSSETRYRRFFVPLDKVEEERVDLEAHRLASIDPTHERALIALVEEQGRDECIGVARYGLLDHRRDTCEASVVIRDDYQGSGLGGQLFDLLVQIALVSGLRHMILLTHADNLGMIALVKRVGLPFKGRYSSGLYEIDLMLSDALKPFFPFTSPEA